MRVTRLSVAGFLALAMTFAWVGAATAATALTLTGPIDGNVLGPQSQSNPCIIAGTQCQQPAGFGFGNYVQGGGGVSNNNVTSTTPTATVVNGVDGNPYTVAQLTAAATNTFVVAIDVNTTGAESEVLQLFQVIDVTTNTILYQYTGPTPIGDISNNGNGFGDWQLGTISLAGLPTTDQILFRASWTLDVDGAESFFLVPATAAVPEPSSLLLGGTVLLGLGYSLRNRIFRRRSQELTAS